MIPATNVPDRAARPSRIDRWGTGLTRENAAPSACLSCGRSWSCVPLTIWFAPLGIDPKMQKALAITAFMIGSWITHCAGRRDQRPDGPVPVLGHRRCRVRRGVSRIRHHHAVVSVRRHPVRADGDQIGACAPARVHDHARHRPHLRATAARNRRRRLPADVHRPVRHRPRRHHVRRRDRPRRRLRRMGAAAGSARACSSSSCTRRRSSTR